MTRMPRRQKITVEEAVTEFHRLEPGGDLLQHLLLEMGKEHEQVFRSDGSIKDRPLYNYHLKNMVCRMLREEREDRKIVQAPGVNGSSTGVPQTMPDRWTIGRTPGGAYTVVNPSGHTLPGQYAYEYQARQMAHKLAAEMAQPEEFVEPDDVPGPFFVSAIDGTKHALVSGPYSTHREAVANRGHAKRLCSQLYPTQSTWASFGTVRMAADFTGEGLLQARHGLPLDLSQAE